MKADKQLQESDFIICIGLIELRIGDECGD